VTQSLLCSRAAASTLIVFEAFALSLFSLGLYAALVRHAGWDGAIIVGILCIAIFLWWRSFLVQIDESELRYRSMFSDKTIKLQHITRAVRGIDLLSKDNRPPNRIEIYGLVDGRDVRFDINVKPFHLADVKKMEQLLHVVIPNMTGSPDFFMSTAGEYDALAAPRACWQKARLRDPVRDDYMLIAIEPALIEQQRKGIEAAAITQLIISTKFVGQTLFPISKWPVPVYVAVILDDAILESLAFTPAEVKLIAWGTLFRTQIEAAKLANRFE
jgi:hypothetical protein